MAFLYRRDRRFRGLNTERGFSLVELVIAMSILAIALGMAMPTFRNVIRNTAVSNQANDVMTSLATARSEAVRRGLQVAVRSVNDSSDWSAGWQVVADSNRDGSFGGTDEVISASPALASQYHVYARSTGGAGVDGRVVFGINGALTNTGFDINICFPTGDATKSRRVRVRASGSASTHKNTTGSTATACPAT